MARLNTTATSTHNTPRPQKGLADRASIERPVTLSRKDSAARPIKGSTLKSKNGPGLTFDIFPDDEDHQPNDEIESPSQSTIPGSSTKQQKKRTLKVSRANSLLLPIQQRPRQRPNAKVEQDDYDKENDITGDAMEPYTPERSPVPHRSATTRNMTHTPTINRELDRSLSRRECKDKDEDSCGDNGFDSMDEFVVSDNDEISYVETSDSETEKALTPPPPPKSARKRLMRGRRPTPDEEVDSTNIPVPQSDLDLEHKAPKTRELPTNSKKDLQKLSHDDFDLSTQFKTLELDDDNGPASQLETDLTQSVHQDSPQPAEMYRVEKNTPTPSTPSKNRLRSPAKQRTRIPPTPHRESVDAFWSQEENINWIDQHSPEKNPATGRRVIELLRDFDDSETDGASRGSTPSMETEALPGVMEKPPKTPSKTAIRKAEAEKNRAAKARRLSFDNKKADFAQTFLAVLDNAVAEGKVTQIASSTGGVKISWSKTLQKTAGRAQWRGERIRDKDGRTISIKHHASIELAERIIDDEYRLINTLAHEYCHLANYMVSNVHDQPHGASFKQWGLKCGAALKDHPVYGGKINVTTKHSYKIDYKYVWSCVGCGQTYGRHSKSIDTTRSRCGDKSCSGRLEQIKPKPRNVSPRKNPATPAAQRKVMDNVSKELGGFTL